MFEVNVQNFLKSCGDNGCYYLCLMEIARREGVSFSQIVEGTQKAIDDGDLFFNWDRRTDPNNFFCANPEMILKKVTNQDWSVTFTKIKNQVSDYDYLIEKMAITNEKGLHEHFRMTDFDPKPDAVANLAATPQSYRAIKKVRI